MSVKIKAFPIAEKELREKSNPFIKEALKNGIKIGGVEDNLKILTNG